MPESLQRNGRIGCDCVCQANPLFIRERYGISPTQLAEEIAPVIVDTLARLDDVILGCQQLDPATATRQFHLAPNSYVEFVLMPRVVARLHALAPFGNALAEAA